MTEFNEEYNYLGMHTAESEDQSTNLYRKYVSPLVFGPPPPHDLSSTVINNGTIVFLRGELTFGVTCWHCINSFKIRKRSEDIELRFGNLVIPDIDSRLIDCDQKMDLATIKVSEEEIAQTGCATDALLHTGRSSKLKNGSAVTIFGFPGQFVKVTGLSSVECGIFSGLELAHEQFQMDKKFIIEFRRDTWNVSFNSLGINIQEFQNFGGLSGCPVFYQGPIMPILVGVVYEDITDLMSGIQARYGHDICPNGKVNY